MKSSVYKNLFSLENDNFASWCISQAIVQGEHVHEGEEEAGRWEEVPDVVVVVHVQKTHSAKYFVKANSYERMLEN